MIGIKEVKENIGNSHDVKEYLSGDIPLECANGMMTGASAIMDIIPNEKNACIYIDKLMAGSITLDEYKKIKETINNRGLLNE